MTDAPTPSANGKSSWWEDLLEIFFAPTKVFTRRANASFWVPLIILTVLGGVLAVGLKPSMDPALEADMDRTIAKMVAENPEIPEASIDQIRSFQSSTGLIFFVVLFPVLALVVGLVLWLIGKFFGAKETLKQAVLISTLASFPRLIGILAAGLQGLLLSEEAMDGMNRLSLGPARFLDPDTTSALTVGMAARFDLTLIWVTILLAIGLKVMGKIPMSKALGAAIVVWILGALPALAQAAQ